LERLWSPDSGAASKGASAASEEEIRTRELRARNGGRDEGIAQAASDYEKKLTGEKKALGDAIHQFARERANYFQRVEPEVVALALAIARKILHRETQVDPLLLAGVVRVGLDKVASGTRVRLRVHPRQVAAWKDFFSQQNDMQSAPELMGDPSLGLAHCILETELGSTDLSLESQLKEIEQGFFDLLAQRPQKTS
jgi:flagellar assembly protein FliH